MTDKIEVTNEKSEDKKDIELEEREKMLNAENKAQEKVEGGGVETGENAADEKKKDIKEGMEVKPKKIPIGGIQMPGFFTRSKSKEKCKEDDPEDQGTDLIETKEESSTNQLRIKLPSLPNPFRKSKVMNETSDENTANNEPKEKKKLLHSIRLPLVSVWPRKKPSDLEMGGQAGLASMETLESTTGDDKNTTNGSANDDMKNISLEAETDEKEPPAVEKKDLETQAVELVQSCRDFFRNYRIVCSIALLLILVTIVIVIATVPDKSMLKVRPIKDGKFVETVTGCGLVEGLVEDSAVAFRGIPYALAPLGPLRFKPAQPLNNINHCWNGTLIAHNSSATCLQIHANGSLSGTESCLTLDVVTPYVRYDNPLPVIVLIGAESFMGGSPGKMRPSARYARSKDVLFVRPNFRLGALGFLALDVLSKSTYPHTSGNYALSDILAALAWVQLNIEHFGGDRKAVTLFGHRAGATLVTALASLPNANKYFARAWASSGGAVFPKRERHEAEIENASFLSILDCQTADCLRTLEAERLTDAVEDTWRRPQPDLPAINEGKRHEWMVLDGEILKEDPVELLKQEKGLTVKLVLGTAAHCAATEKLLLKNKNWSDGLIKKHINESFIRAMNLTKDVLERYNATYKGLSGLISDIRTVCPLYHLKKQIPGVSFYVVTQARWETDLADVDSDVDAILGRYEPKTPEQKRYFSAMQGLFYHFVWFGTIEVKEGSDQVLIVGQDVLPNSTYGNCDFLEERKVVPEYAALD